MDLLEHFEHGHVGPAMQRTPQCADGRGARCEEVGLARANDPDGRGTAILLVVGVQEQYQVQRIDHLGAGDVLLVGHREHHVQKVGDVRQLGVGINERQAHRAAIRIGGDGPHLADQPRRLLIELSLLGRGLSLVAAARKAGECIDHG